MFPSSLAISAQKYHNRSPHAPSMHSGTRGPKQERQDCESIAASLGQPLLEPGQSSLALLTHPACSSPARRLAAVDLTCPLFFFSF